MGDFVKRRGAGVGWLGQFADLRGGGGGGVARKRGLCFLGSVDTPMHTMTVIELFGNHVAY